MRRIISTLGLLVLVSGCQDSSSASAPVASGPGVNYVGSLPAVSGNCASRTTNMRVVVQGSVVSGAWNDGLSPFRNGTLNGQTIRASRTAPNGEVVDITGTLNPDGSTMDIAFVGSTSRCTHRGTLARV